MGWQTIAEGEDAVVVLRGFLATRPLAYERFWARAGRETGADRVMEMMQRFASFAFSGVVHILAVVLLAELVVIAVPIVEETILTAQLYRPTAKADVPSPQPASKPDEQKFERAAEAPTVAEEEPQPAKAEAARVIGSGTNESARPVSVGVLESVQELREEGLAHLTGTGLFESRSEGARREAVGRYGGNEASEAAVESGLKWLAAHQSEDGRWSPVEYANRCGKSSRCGPNGSQAGYEHGVTGLALLAFLSAGYTHRQGTYQDIVKKALDWLVERQDKSGFFFDSVRETMGNGWPGGMYGHGVATFALGEAAAITRDPALMKPLARAVAAIHASQESSGGWGYTVRPSGGTEFTLSVWQMMGLKAAHTAGVDVPQAVVERAKAFVRSSTAPNGGVYYSGRSNITQGATAAGLFARCMFGLTEGGAMEKGIGYLEKSPQMDPALGRNQSFEYLYYWYYRTLVSFQMQGRRWRDWNAKMRPYLVSSQRTRGHAAGSWTAIDYNDASLVYTTSLCVLMLETYYRYLPMVSDRSAVVGALEGTVLDFKEDPGVEEVRLARVAATAEELAAARLTERDEALKRLKSARQEDRYVGARRLAELGEKGALKEMIAAADRETGRIKAVHVGCIGRLKSEDALPYLLRQLDDADDTVRMSAMSALINTTGVYIWDVPRWKDWYQDYQKQKAEKKK